MPKLKDKVARSLYAIVLSLAKTTLSKPKDRHLLLIKNDEIGDYFLFRNFLKDIRTSEKYKHHKITLLGNAMWRPLLEAYDAQYVDDVLWLDKKKFKRELSYRLRFLKNVRKLGFDEVVNCIYSRNILNDDCFAAVVNCKQKIAMESVSVSRSDIYTHYINTGDTNKFELLRNATFLSQLLNIKEDSLNAAVFIDQVSPAPVPKDKYCVVFAGAGKQDKLWQPESFATIIKYILSNYRINVILSGGKGDMKDSERVKSLVDTSLEDYTGKMAMPETLALLKNAAFMLSVDTGSVHMGASVKCPVIALYSGRDYGRFAPYPEGVFDQFYTIFSDNVDQVRKANPEALKEPDTFLFSEIRNIPPEKVVPYIDRLLSK